ncbi:hypothetical protein [Nonomuraea sp. NPDC049709]|uniref:hypothetical protein n=1 Tax=Nonomuraea sp. NPDC049709 TaxID=3154736 RepID=UPI00341FB4A5
MDVRAEILDLKLRVEDLETTAERGTELDRQDDLLREIIDRSRKLQAEIAFLKAELGRARTEIGEEFAAVGTEIAGVRREVTGRPVAAGAGTGGEIDVRAEIAVEFGAIRSEIEHEFNFLRSEVTDLGIKLDRLLQRTPAEP